jgi:hypothetical protein
LMRQAHDRTAEGRPRRPMGDRARSGSASRHARNGQDQAALGAKNRAVTELRNMSCLTPNPSYKSIPESRTERRWLGGQASRRGRPPETEKRIWGDVQDAVKSGAKTIAQIRQMPMAEVKAWLDPATQGTANLERIWPEILERLERNAR